MESERSRKRARLNIQKPSTLSNSNTGESTTSGDSKAKLLQRGSSHEHKTDNPDADGAEEIEFKQVTTLSDDLLVPNLDNAEVYYMSDFVTPDTAQEWYNELLCLETWYRPKLKLFGREITQSRKIAAYTTSPTLNLTYSGQTVDMHRSYPPLLLSIQRAVEDLLDVKFNHVMLNLYEDGDVHIGSHRDSPDNKVIAALSLGAVRTFNMTPDDIRQSTASKKQKTASTGSSDNKKSKIAFPLASGSLLVMQGDTQRFWKHEVPKEPRVKNGRISLTFRQLVT